MEEQDFETNINFDLFYEEKVENIPIEREIFQRYLKLIEPKKHDSHLIEWQNKKLIEQTKLSNEETNRIDIEIYNIKNNINSIKEEINHKKNNQNLRKEQINRLIKIAGPIESDITYIVPDLFINNDDNKNNINPYHYNKLYNKNKDEDIKKKKNIEENQKDETNNTYNKYCCLLKTGEISRLESILNNEIQKLRSFIYFFNNYINNSNNDYKSIHSVLTNSVIGSSNELNNVEFINQKTTDTDNKIKKIKKNVKYFDELNQEETEEDNDEENILNHKTSISLYNTAKLAYKQWEETEENASRCYSSVSSLLKLRLNILIAQRKQVEILEELENEKKLFCKKEERIREEVS